MPTSLNWSARTPWSPRRTNTMPPTRVVPFGFTLAVTWPSTRPITKTTRRQIIEELVARLEDIPGVLDPITTIDLRGRRVEVTLDVLWAGRHKERRPKADGTYSRL